MRLHALMVGGRRESALAAADELLERFGGSAEPELRSEISRALLARTWVEMRAGRRNAAIAASNDLIAQFDDTTDPIRMSVVGAALRYAGSTLMDQKAFGPLRLLSNRKNKECSDQGLRILELLRARLETAADPELQKLMVQVVIVTGHALAGVGHFRQAVATLESIFDLGDPALAALEENEALAEQSPRPRDQLALTLAGEVGVLQELGRRDEADAKIDEIIARFQDDRSPVIKLIVYGVRHVRATKRR
ncbi:MAG TPA: hypothetical protein VG388_09715 [Solirubrobacteraceae bacterium]|nr:hypothetical protein [Solirubrobacteraceae bacterium]